MVIPWAGFSLSKLLNRVQPMASAKYVAFQTLHDPVRMPGQNSNVLEWPYVEGLRLDEAMHPLTLLASGLHHPDVRVRRTAVHALGQVPLHRRTPLLVQQLDTRDTATRAVVLTMLTREPDPRAVTALVERIASADFESRPEDERVSLIAALGEIANDGAVATAIARIGTPQALELLHDGLRARSEAIRTACLEALGGQEKTA